MSLRTKEFIENLEPVPGYLLVILHEPSKKLGNIIQSINPKTPPLQGIILKVGGPRYNQSLEELPTLFNVGDLIIFDPYSISSTDEDMYIMSEEENKKFFFRIVAEQQVKGYIYKDKVEEILEKEKELLS